MPRKAPKDVIEHRITFGDYERKLFNQSLDSYTFKNYAAPLQSPVVAVGLLGGAGYLALAYAMDWWPFKSGSFSLLDLPPIQKQIDMQKARQEGRLAQYVRHNYENEILPAHHAKVAKAQTWLNEHPSPSGPFEIMMAKNMQLIVDSNEMQLERLAREFEERLAIATRNDEEVAANQDKS